MAQFKYGRFNKTQYETHMIVFDLIAPRKTILDIGCATGYFAQKLKEKNCRTYGVEIDKIAAQEARRFCEKVIIGDIQKDSKLGIPRNYFDYILLLDVLEHLEKPERVLRDVKKYLRRNGRVIISVPNVAHLSVRLELLFGSFRYSKFGILDKRHLRFFTKQSFIELIHKANFNMRHFDYSADFGQLPICGKIIKKRGKRWQYLVTKWFNSLLAVQFIAVCTI